MGEAVVTLRNRRNKAMADQLTTASKKRLTKRMGRLASDDLHAVEDAIRVQLGLDPVFNTA